MAFQVEEMSIELIAALRPIVARIKRCDRSLAERRLAAGQSAKLGALMNDVLNPPIERMGALSVNTFMKKTERRSLAAALNTLLASPSLASWRQGTSLDVAEWVAPKDGKTPIVIVSVAHLDDEERALVLGVRLEEILSWVWTLPGSQRLRVLVMSDEVYGFLPPHPQNPPTKRPLVALMKQARGTEEGWADELSNTLTRLAPRWFVVRNAHVTSPPILVQPRFAMSLMRGPMTRVEIRAARERWVEGTAKAGVAARVVTDGVNSRWRDVFQRGAERQNAVTLSYEGSQDSRRGRPYQAR